MSGTDEKRTSENNVRAEQDREWVWSDDKCVKDQSNENLQEWKQTRRWLFIQNYDRRTREIKEEDYHDYSLERRIGWI